MWNGSINKCRNTSNSDADPPRQDAQHQVEHKEGADDDERDEVDPVPHGTQGVVSLKKKEKNNPEKLSGRRMS